MIIGVSDFSTTEPFDNAEIIIDSGMDFIEAGCAKVTALPEDTFQARATELKKQNIKIQSMNWFLPPDLKVVGPEANEQQSQDFLQTAISRATTLGAKAIVFGSPASRSIPPGFSESTANDQVIQFCHQFADVAESLQSDVRLAVEHVNHTETNHINTFAQAAAIVTQVDRQAVGLAADLYHFYMEKEDLAIIKDHSQLIHAVQLAEPTARVFPTPDQDIWQLDRFLQTLSDIGYRGGVSVEAVPSDDLAQSCRDSASVLRAAISNIS